MEIIHKPVMVKEVIGYLQPPPKGVYFDGTIGGGGHTEEILKAGSMATTVIGADIDDSALEYVRKRLERFGKQLVLIKDNYRNIRNVIKRLKIDYLDGIFLDLGVSSFQLEIPERGFSFMKEGILDMRMDQSSGDKAKDILMKLNEKEIENVLRDLGEERFAKRIAKKIVETRRKKPIDTTFDLVNIINSAIPKIRRFDKIHPATRSFQAFRILVNDELNNLRQFIPDAVVTLKEGGRICIISYHSLEDRIVKGYFNSFARGCICPDDFPTCVCKREKKLKILTKRPIRPSQEEIKLNPRARSAKLRVAERIIN